MIPLRDTAPQSRLPLANWALLALCAAGFVEEIRAGPGLENMIHEFGLIPARFVTLGERAGFTAPDVWTPFVTSAFLHGDALHFASNMLFLWIFGGPVEGRMGHAGYPLFWLAGAVVAGLAQVAAHPDSVVPMIGASGAIAAVMGAYFLLYPRAWIVSIVPPFFWVQIRIPALLYLAFWFGVQVYMASAADEKAHAGVAWWAHAGGFAFGMAIIVWIGWRTSDEA